jgi:hypothetical protein
VAIAVLGLVSTPAAFAVDCGKPAAPGGQPTTAGLSYDEASSQNHPLKFGTSTANKQIVLVYSVEGCTLTGENPPQARVRADPEVLKAIETPKLSIKGSKVVIDIDVRGDFPTGTASALLTVSGKDISTVVQSLSLQRKEPPLLPLLVTLIGALAGIVWALFSARKAVEDKRKAKEVVTWKARHVVSAVVLGVIATYAVFQASYLTPEVFTLEFGSGLALFAAAGAAAAGGAKAGAEGSVAVEKRQKARK